VSREKAEILIIGSGIAGCTAAITASASGKRVLLLTKTADPMESNTRYAQGGIVALGENDSRDLLYDDIVKAGDGISNPDAVRIVVDEGPALVRDFLIDRLGVSFSKNPDGSLSYTQEAAHSRKRILHHLDMTGLAIERALIEKIRTLGNITLLTDHTAIDFITTHHNSKNPLRKYGKNLCLGAYALNNRTGEVNTFLADATVVATGGIGKLYQYTTNPECATGDGIAMAFRTGAEMANMEYVQFHPTVFHSPNGGGFLISEAVRGEGGRLLNKHGEEFMRRYAPKWKELAPRDEVARAIYNEMAQTDSNHVFLDVAHYRKKELNIRERFPAIYEECLKHKIDIEKEPIPVVPAEHYLCGGILSGNWGESTLPGLFAVGECACTGVHGANRLASVSLLEGLVFGKRAGDMASRAEKKDEYFGDMPDWVHPKKARASTNDPFLNLQDWIHLRTTMWNYVGIIRTETRLDRAESDLRNLGSRITDYYRNTMVSQAKIELRNGIIVANLIAQFARRNRTTIGCHYIKDED
jgi:L-aspartate oxidase